MSARFYKSLLCLSLGLLMLAGCQSDSEGVSPNELRAVKVLTFELLPGANVQNLSEKVETIQGFLFSKVVGEERIAFHFADIASDEYLKKRTKEVFGSGSGHFVSLSNQKVPMPNALVSVKNDAGTNVRKSIEKPKAPIQQFPNVFDLFRFLF